ncbi:MAG: very short patch repair endonuclease [Vulcanimicrobiaceae bacterium]
MNKSQQMSLVRSRDTAPELLVRRLLSDEGVRYRLHRRDLPGRPDLYVPRLRLAIFVNGCFWHGHACARGRRPKTNVAFWDQKISINIARDTAAQARLLETGIKTIVLWTCQLDAAARICRRVSRRYRRAPKRR